MTLTITRNRRADFDLTIRDASGAAVDLAGRTLAFVAARALDAGVDIGPVTVTIVDAPTGRARLTLPAALTSALARGAVHAFHYEIRMQEGAGDLVVVRSGQLIIVPPVE